MPLPSRHLTNVLQSLKFSRQGSWHAAHMLCSSLIVQIFWYWDFIFRGLVGALHGSVEARGGKAWLFKEHSYLKGLLQWQS